MFSLISQNIIKLKNPKSKDVLKLFGFVRKYQKFHGRNLHGVNLQSRENSLIEFKGDWPQPEKDTFIKDMRILTDFLTNDEETKILEEIEPYLKRLRYEFDHWDDAIHGYRETERKHWYPDNRKTIQRVSDAAFDGEIMPYIHILDLDEKGLIKPHVDSTRYCGTTIAGLSLLSDCVMRLVRTDEKKFVQGKPDTNSNNNDNKLDSDDFNYRNQPSPSAVGNFYADILLRRHSLYIMSNSARYNFTHEILSNDNSEFMGGKIIKTRRISIICRNEP